MANEQYEIYEEGTAAALAELVLDRLDTKADYDGYYAQLTAGAADSLTGRGDGVSASYLYRTTGGDADVADGTATVKSIHGRTLVWNQMTPDVSSSRWSAYSNVTKTVDSENNSITLTSNTSSSVPKNAILDNVGVAGHKYYVAAHITNNSEARAYVGLFKSDGSSDVTVILESDSQSGRYAIVGVSSNPAYFAIRMQNSTADGKSATFKDIQLVDLTTMFGAGNEPSTVAEFEALYPEPYYEYDAGSLLSVQMGGIETVGFNQWDEEWEAGGLNTVTGETTTTSGYYRSKNYIPVFPGVDYYIKAPVNLMLFFYDKQNGYISYISDKKDTYITVPDGAYYMRFRNSSQNAWTPYNNDICINLSWSGYRNGEYEPYWQSERTIPAATYFPNGMRSAGTVRDELTSTEAITRVGAVDLGTLTWSYNSGGYFYSSVSEKAVGNYNLMCDRYETTSSDSVASMADKQIKGHASTNSIYIKDSSFGTDGVALKASLGGVYLFYALATPTVTPIDPALNLTYRVSDFGTERVMHTDPTAAPTLVVTYGSTADGIRDAALACIAPVENGRASANYGVGSYLIHGGTLCRVTTAIATGEAITIGTNVTATTVMAELLTLTQ